MKHEHDHDHHNGGDSGLTCRDTTHLVCSSRDEPLTPEQTAQLQTHLAGCDYCRVASQQFGRMFAQLDELFAREETPVLPAPQQGKKP